MHVIYITVYSRSLHKSKNPFGCMNLYNKPSSYLKYSLLCLMDFGSGVTTFSQ